MTGSPPPGTGVTLCRPPPRGQGAWEPGGACFGLLSPRPVPLISLTESLTC